MSSSNTSGVRSLSPVARDRAIEEQELRAKVLRVTRVVFWGIIVGTASGLLDWVAVTYIEPGRLWILWTIRAAGDALFVAVLLRLRRRPMPSLQTFRILNVTLFGYAS